MNDVFTPHTQIIHLLQGSNVNKCDSVFKPVDANDRLQKKDKDMVLLNKYSNAAQNSNNKANMNVVKVDSTHSTYFLQGCTIILIACLMSEKHLEMFSPLLALNFQSRAGGGGGGHSFGYTHDKM